MAPPAKRAAAAAVALVLTMAACGSDDDAGTADGTTTTAPTTTSSSAPEALPQLHGRFLFSRFTESNHEFVSTHIANADGTDEHELTLPGPEGGGQWSHDGQQIAVMTITDDDRVGTAVIAPDGTVVGVLELPDPTINLVCTVWSPDDARIACEGWDDTDESRRGIYVVDAADGGNPQRLTTAGAGLADFPGDFSPDGTQLVFRRSSAGSETDGPLLLVPISGGEPHELSAGSFEDDGRFSADGMEVLTSSSGSLVVLDLDGEVVREIDDDAYLFGAVWSPDGEWIAYSRSVGGPHADIYVSRPDGSRSKSVV